MAHNTSDPRSKFERKYRTIWIGNIPFDTFEDEVKDYFLQCGEIEPINRPKMEDGERHRGFAFIQFKNQEAVIEGEKLNGQEFKGRCLNARRLKAE